MNAKRERRFDSAASTNPPGDEQANETVSARSSQALMNARTRATRRAICCALAFAPLFGPPPSSSQRASSRRFSRVRRRQPEIASVTPFPQWPAGSSGSVARFLSDRRLSALVGVCYRIGYPSSDRI
uniref:Uncharacterized protein n=1 Tax=Plectus sambesii TaxID=2011161 RepID=A0A914VTR7_9BILA